MMPVGARLDLSFKLKVVRDGRTEEVHFSDLLTRPTIVSVYMRNNTPGCDRQNESLTVFADRAEKAHCNLVALSRDGCRSHERYARDRGIRYLLASDPNDHFARAADAIVQKSMYGRTFEGPSRSAFLLNQDGVLLGVIAKVDPARHAEQLNDLLNSLCK